MPIYTYRARDKQGELFSAQIEAESDITLAERLRAIGYTVISIDTQTHLKIRIADFWQRITKSYQYELIFFSRQLASLLRSGISITVALSSIAEQSKNKILKSAIYAILGDIQSGVTFSNALAKHPDIFSDLFVSMIKAGETAGILVEVLERLSQLKTQEFEMKTRIQSAMMYPSILVGLTVVIVSFLLVNVIPKFVVIFQTYDAKLPIATQLLLGISYAIRRLWYIIVVLACAVIFFLSRYLKTEKGRYGFDLLVLRMPLFGQLNLKIVISRFARILGALIKTGIPLLEALNVTNKTIRNIVINRIIDSAYVAVSEGQPLTDPLKTSGIFPTTVIQMIYLGEKSGNLDQMLSEIASFYEREIDYTVKNLTTALEPALLLVMGLMVAFIALSVLLPIFNLIKIFRY
jgi:type IV pilus assembly protein PilC